MKTMFIAVLLLAAQASAQTPFETLRQAFHQASEPATIQDFEQGTWENCLFSDVANPYRTRDTQVRTLKLDSPGNGPLFPGDQAYRVDVFLDYSLDQNLFSFFQHSRIRETETTFVQTLDGPPWRRVNVLGRVHEEMLLFRVDLSDYQGPQAPMYERVYGYCWNNTRDDNDGDRDDGENDGGNGEQPLPIPPNPT